MVGGGFGDGLGMSMGDMDSSRSKPEKLDSTASEDSFESISNCFIVISVRCS